MFNIIIGFQDLQKTKSESPSPKDLVCGKHPLTMTGERRWPNQKQGQGGSNSQHPRSAGKLSGGERRRRFE